MFQLGGEGGALGGARTTCRLHLQDNDTRIKSYIYSLDIIVREVKFDEGEVWNKHVYIQIHKVMAMHTISLSLSPLISTASRTVNVLVTTELCLEPSRDVATALIVTYY